MYVQLPQQLDPQALWPKFEWQDVSNQYDSLFFRVVGKYTKQFGAKQDSSSGFSGVEESQRVDCKSSLNSFKANEWTDWVVSGSSEANSRPSTCLRFKSDEVKPMNTAIKVWIRTK